MTIGPLLETRDARILAAAIADRWPHEAGRLAEAMGAALGDGRRGVRSFVRAWRDLVRRVLEDVRAARPDLVSGAGGDLAIVDGRGRPSPAATRLLDIAAIEAPFSAWVAAFGPGTGALAFLVARVREALPGVEPVAAPPAGERGWSPGAGPEAAQRFLLLAWEELAPADPPLESLRRTFDLSVTELGRLFGVSRQAAGQWLEHGVPAARQPKVATVVAIGELLAHKLKPGLVGAVARRPAPAHDGLTMLEMIERDRHEELRALVERSFDWAATA